MIVFVEQILFDLEMKEIIFNKVLMQKEHTEYANIYQLMGSVVPFF